MPTTIVEVDFSLSNLSDAQSQVDAFYGSLQQIEQEAPQISSLLSAIAPSLDLSGLQSQVDSLTSQLGDLNAAAELNTESLTNFGATTETTTEQVAALGSASEDGATHTRSHGQAAGEAESEFSAFGEALGEVANIIPGLNSGLSQGGSLLGAFSQEAEEGQSQMALVGAGIAAIGVGIAGLSFEAFDHGVESIHLLAEQTGMTDQSVAGFQLTLKEAGLSADTANMALERIMMNTQNLISNLDAGKAPTGTFATGLNEIGISAQQAAATGGDMNQLLPLIADGFQKTSEAAQANGQSFDATGVAMQIFGGRYGAQLAPILVQGSAALKENTQYVQGLGLASEQEVAHLEDWNVAQAKAAEAGFALAASIGSDLAPAMKIAANAVGGAAAAFDQLPGPLKDSLVTLPLLAGAGFSAAAGVGKLFDLMGSGIDTVRTAASTVSTAAQATVSWATSLDTETVSAAGAATAEGSLATAEGAVAAGSAGLDASAEGMATQGTAAPGVEAAAAAEEHLATAEGLVGAGGVTAGAGLTTAGAGAQTLAGGALATTAPLTALVALIGGGIAIEAKFKDEIADAAGSMGEYVGGLGLMGAGLNGLVDHLNGASESQDKHTEATKHGGDSAVAASPEVSKLASAIGLTGSDAQAAAPFLQQFIEYEDKVGGNALTAAKGVAVLDDKLSTMSALLNEHLSTGATGTAGFETLDKQIDNTTKVMQEEQKAATDAAEGNTALSQAEYALADAYRSGNAVEVAKANQTIALLPPTKDLTDATLAGIQAQKDETSGKTASAAAEQALQAAYQSGDPARIQTAQNDLKIAQAEDQVTTASGKADTAALHQADSLQSVQDALSKAGAAADQLNTKYNDLITGAFLKANSLSQQSIALEQQKGDAAYNAAQTAYAAWQGFDSAYQADLANEATAIQNNDKVGADYWKNQAADANTSANDQKTALSGFITEAEKDLGQAHTDSQTLYKDMATAARSSVADQKSAMADLVSYAKDSAIQIPASFSAGWSQAENTLQGIYGQLTALDQSYSAGVSGLSQQQYQDQRQNLQNELSDANQTYSAEAQAGKDMATAISDARKADYDTSVQLLQMEEADRRESAATQETITVDSINLQEQLNVDSRKKDADQLNQVLESEKNAVLYYDGLKEEADEGYAETQQQIAIAKNYIMQDQANKETALANLEASLAEAVANAQVDSSQKAAVAATTSADATVGAWQTAYGQIGTSSVAAANTQIQSAIDTYNGIAGAIDQNIDLNNQAIAALTLQGESYKQLGTDADNGLSIAKQAASDAMQQIEALTSATNNAGQAALNAGNDYHDLAEQASGFGGFATGGGPYTAGGAETGGGGGSGGGSGGGLGGSGITGVTGGGPYGGSSGVNPNYNELSLLAGSSLQEEFSLAVGGNMSAIQSLLQLQNAAPGSYSYWPGTGEATITDYIRSGAWLQSITPSGVTIASLIGGGATSALASGASGGASVPSQISALESELVPLAQQISLATGQNAIARQDELTAVENQLESLGVTMSTILSFLQSNGLTVNVGNAPALATAISSGATQSQTMRPV